MSNIILLKRKTTTGQPNPASLQTGEACYVLPDKTLYIKNDDNTVTVINSSGGSSVIKGTANIIFSNQKEATTVVLNANIDANSVIIPSIQIINDEIFAENFQTQITKQIGFGFTIFCSPKIGRYTGTVTINYIIQ